MGGAHRVARPHARGWSQPAGHGDPLRLDRESANFLKHANRDPDAWLLEIDPIIPEIVFHEAIALYRMLTDKTTAAMTVAQRVIDMKFGFGPYGDGADRRREEECECERRIENMDDEEDRQRAQRDLDGDRRCRQSGLLAFGRSLLTGEPMFPPKPVTIRQMAGLDPIDERTRTVFNAIEGLGAHR